jgi:hypothetical protein
VSFSVTARIDGAPFLGKRSTLYFVVERVGWRIAERRLYIHGGVRAAVMVDNNVVVCADGVSRSLFLMEVGWECMER